MYKNNSRVFSSCSIFVILFYFCYDALKGLKSPAK